MAVNMEMELKKRIRENYDKDITLDQLSQTITGMENERVKNISEIKRLRKEKSWLVSKINKITGKRRGLVIVEMINAMQQALKKG